MDLPSRSPDVPAQEAVLLVIRLTHDTGENGVVSAGTNGSAVLRRCSSADKMKSIALLFVLGVIGASPYQ